MEDVLYKFKVVWQIVNTRYGLVAWIIFSIMLMALLYVVSGKITLRGICKALVYSYPFTGAVFFVLLVSVENKADWQFLLGIVIAVALPLAEMMIKKMVKCIRMSMVDIL